MGFPGPDPNLHLALCHNKSKKCVDLCLNLVPFLGFLQFLMVSELVSKKLVPKKSESVLKNFGTEKSLGIGLKKFGTEKSLGISIVQILGLVTHYLASQ